jgi:type I restriction enzyme, R subunit
VAAEACSNGMLAHDRLLDIVENFILFDESKAGATRKVVARNHQVLGVNRAVASVVRQEALKATFPPGERLRHRVSSCRCRATKRAGEARKGPGPAAEPAALPSFIPEGPVDIIERAHPDLGRLGVFWHTQGSGKSYSMAFFAEKVRRKVPGNFTFLLMTDRNDLDSQIYKTFVGCGVAGRPDAARRFGQGSEKPAEGEPPLRLQPDPQVQPGRDPTSPTASATTSS